MSGGWKSIRIQTLFTFSPSLLVDDRRPSNSHCVQFFNRLIQSCDFQDHGLPGPRDFHNSQLLGFRGLTGVIGALIKVTTRVVEGMGVLLCTLPPPRHVSIRELLIGKGILFHSWSTQLRVYKGSNVL